MLCFFCFFFFFSSRANPEPGPGLPLRCSLAHKHKTAFIILPVAAQGLASKSYWFLSSLSPLHKGRAFCKLLARFRPTKGTFIEPSPPHCSLSILPPFDFAQIWLQGLKKERKKREEEIRKPHRWRVHSVLWMALYGLPLYMWQSKDASAAPLKKELDKIIGLAAFLHDWHGELWERKACLLFLLLSLSLHLALSLGRTPSSKQTKRGVWLWEKERVCLPECVCVLSY